MKKIISILIIIILIIIYLIYNNYGLYHNINEFIDRKQFVINSNDEKIIYIKNNNKSNIYNFYILNNKYELDNIEIYINNKLIDSNYIYNNNYIIYSLVLNKGENRAVSIRIKESSNSNYLIGINMVKKDITLSKLIKKKSSNKIYHVDTDSAKELYKIGNVYKYIGKVPNNYIYFNCKSKSLSSCELYRIIGITEKGVKIIKNSYEKYKNTNYNIYEKNKLLVSDDKIDILSLDDYIDSYKLVDNKCVKNIYKCSKKSYLTPIKNEVLKKNNRILTISNKEKKEFYRPILYLRQDIKVLGGNGSYKMPYFLNN